MLVAYYVVEDSVLPPAFTLFEGFERLEELLAQRDLTLGDPELSDSEVQRIHFWPVQERDAAFCIYDNHVADVRHVEVRAADEDLLVQLCDALVRAIPLEPHDALVEGWAAGTFDAPNTLVKIALSGDAELGHAALDAVVSAFAHPSPRVRCMATYAAALHGDPRFEQPLRARRPVEPDPNARNIIDQALWLYDNP